MPDKKWNLFAREYVVSLFPATHLADSLGFTIKRMLGRNLGEFACKLEDHAIWWLATSGWGSAHRQLVRRIEHSPKWFPGVLRQIEQEAKLLVQTARRLSSGNLGKLSPIALYRRYAKFRQLNLHLYDIGLLCPLLDYQNDTYLSDAVNAILSRRVLPQQVSRYFTILTTPLRSSLDQIQEELLLVLYARLLHSKRLVRTLLKDSTTTFLQQVRQQQPKWHKALLSHVQRFASLPYVYEGPPADEAYFIDMLRDFARRRLVPRVALAAKRRERQELAKQQRQYLKGLKLTPAERRVIMLARDTTFIKPHRRLLQSQAYYEFEPVLAEIARRLGLSLRQVRYLLSDELKLALRRGQADVDELNHRLKRCVYVNANGRVQLLVGKKVDAFWRKVRQEKVPRRVRELRGTTACAGRARGRVCIVNTPEDMARMKQGNILVSFATSPNLMPAIRQAAAIVTDEGGLTSHAAIVSRELRIPCVIGTKVATRVLKNGDKVFVNAEQGLVKKL